MIASGMGRLNFVEALLSLGANPNLYTKLKITSLMSAAKNGHDEIVKALIKAGMYIFKCLC